MAGLFTSLFRVDFLASNSLVVNHNLNRPDVYVQLIIDGVVDNSLISGITFDPINPLNSLTVEFSTIIALGSVQLVGTNAIQANVPPPTSLVSFADDNISAISNPSINDDSSKNYSVGSAWVNIASGESFICVNDTVGAAEWNKTSGVTETLDNITAVIDPTALNDSTQGYSVGSAWVNISSGQSFVCVDEAVGAAIWNQTSGAIPSLDNIAISAVNPGSTDDSSKGYSIGSSWINAATGETFICVDTTVNFAIWNQTSGSAATLNNSTAVTNPTVNDDYSLGYSSGSIWINTLTAETFTCTSSLVGAAIWNQTSGGTATLNNVAVAAVNPTFSDDSSLDYTVGSMWVNAATGGTFICVDASIGAAIWNQTSGSAGTLNNISATIDPTATDDYSAGYSTGSIWVNTVSAQTYLCVDPTIGAAVWTLTSGTIQTIDNVNAASTDPQATDDSSQGYSVGSIWINTSNLTTFTCVDNSISSAVWTKTSNVDFKVPTVVTTSPYTVLPEDTILLMSVNSGVVNLPQISSHVSKQLIIKDIVPKAEASPIVINSYLSETIDGEASFSIDSDYASIGLIANGTEWSVI